MAWYQISGPCEPFLVGYGWHPVARKYFPLLCSDCYVLVAVKVRWRDRDLYSKVVSYSYDYNGTYLPATAQTDGCAACGISDYWYSNLEGSISWDYSDGLGLPRSGDWILDYYTTTMRGTATCSYKVEVAPNQWVWNSTSRDISDTGYVVTSASKTALVKDFSASDPVDPGYPGGTAVGLTRDELVSTDSGYNVQGDTDTSHVYDRVYTYRVNNW